MTKEALKESAFDGEEPSLRELQVSPRGEITDEVSVVHGPDQDLIATSDAMSGGVDLRQDQVSDGLCRRALLAHGLGLVGLPLSALLASPREVEAATPRLTRGKLSHLQGIADAGSMVRGQGLKRPGVVFEVHHGNVFPLGGYVPSKAAVQRMLAKLMMRLTREPTSTKAWSRLFGAGDKVGVLVDAEGSAATRTRKTVVMAVLRSLLAAGVSANDIIVWTTFGRQLPQIGFNLNWRNNGIKFVGADQMGFDRRYPLRGLGGGGGLLGGGGKYFLSKIVSQACTHIINIATLEDHPIIGSRMCLAQQAVSSFSNGKQMERYWGGARGIGTVASMPVMQRRFVLHLVDGLAGTFNGSLNPWRPQVLLGSTDPVAIDRVGFALIDSQRRRAGVPVITGTRRTPAYINQAALNGAGRANIQQIGHAKIILK